MIRVDRGTAETDVMTTIHSLLHLSNNTFEDVNEIVEKLVLYGPSTANKIERWWRELHHHLESYFKEKLSFLINNGHYDQTKQRDR